MLSWFSAAPETAHHALRVLYDGIFIHFWVFDWTEVMHVEVLSCSVFLMLGGILCAAAGIGGGGIIVTVLMVFGIMSPYDAVPLSKAVVFFGAMMQLVQNFGKKQTMASNAEEELIDWGIVRLIVPMALTGTLLGVALNSDTPGWLIVVMLSVVLGSMTWASLSKALQQKNEEDLALNGDTEEARLLPGPAQSSSQAPISGPPPAPAPIVGTSGEKPQSTDEGAEVVEEAKKKSGLDASLSYLMLGSLLCLVIVCGVLRHHVGFCLDELQSGTLLADIQNGESACRHPVLEVLFGDRMEVWLKQGGTATGFVVSMLIFPIFVCLAIGAYFAMDLKEQGWAVSTIICYQSMALITGTLAGLVGIGGGLVFSPFLLYVGVEPSRAVATSATCVIFTSSSTTMQYILIDRIHMALAVFYGIVNVVASAIGTKVTHYLQENFRTRRSIISFIVAGAVGASMAMSLYKAYGEFSTEVEKSVGGKHAIRAMGYISG